MSITFHDKEHLANVCNGEIIPDCLHESKCNHNGPYKREARGSESKKVICWWKQRLEWFILKTEEVAVSQGRWAAPRSWKDKEIDSLLGASRRKLLTSSHQPRETADFDLQKYENHFVLFSATLVIMICHSIWRKQARFCSWTHYLFIWCLLSNYTLWSNK